jgi:hypothetical protein
MITEFAELELALRTDYDLLYNLPPEAIKSLHIEIQKWDDEKFEPVKDMFHDYYGIANIPTDVLRDICMHDVELAYEIHCEAVTDTSVRDQFGGRLMRYIGMPAWPCYGDSKEYTAEFYTKLPEALMKHGMFVLAG